MSFDKDGTFARLSGSMSQSLWNRAMSFDEAEANLIKRAEESQSLWNRAMSFDIALAERNQKSIEVSIPLEQGNVFRPIKSVLMNLS